MLRRFVPRTAQRLGSIALTLLAIILLTSFGLTMAERGRQGLPSEAWRAVGDTLRWAGGYLVDHPATYSWHKQTVAAPALVLTVLGRSAGLLLLSLGVAAALGVPLGIAAALNRRKGGGPFAVLLSILGMSTPSFLLAMLLWVINIGVHRTFQTAVLPAAGFGWDAHVVMPAIVLAARPLAQVAQVTYVAMSEQLDQDYVRTAKAKGLAPRAVLNRHALRNILIPILTTLGTSLRFSLSSLPVVESFFGWPGVGYTLLEAIAQGQDALVTDLILSLGLFFLVINRVLELLYPLLDPRLRNGGQEQTLRERLGWRERLREAADTLAEWWEDLRRPLRRRKGALPPLPAGLRPAEIDAGPLAKRLGPRRWIARHILSNPALLAGAVLVAALVLLGAFGHRLTPANPYAISGIRMIEGQIAPPPFAPSTVFPWGSDQIGRDVQALVLWGGRQTLTLAFFAMLARVIAGAVLGLLAGWWQGSWLDRLLNGAIGVWAAFPATLLAVLLIQALGIQQGMGVFIIALCIVGWSEVAQFVRAQVIAIKPQLFIEAARAVGARPGQILVRHILPHLVAPLLVMAALEMGGTLLLLSELGYLNTFLGGGFKVELANEQISAFSDVPEWGAMLANVRVWWRSYPWMAWYPGLAFFLSIVAFNLFGEGLRRFLESTRANLSRLINRYTLAAFAVVVLGLSWALRGTTPLAVYQSAAREFDARRALEDIRVLAGPDFQGRETGTEGARLAADYIAARMEAIGLSPAGEKGTFIQTMAAPRYHLLQVPELQVLDERGKVAESLSYHQDFTEYTLQRGGMGFAQGQVVGLALGADPNTAAIPYLLDGLDLAGKVVLLRETDLGRMSLRSLAGVLLVANDPATVSRRYLYPAQGHAISWPQPVLLISPSAADRLLSTAGSSLAELDRRAAALPAGGVAASAPGATLRLAVPAVEDIEDVYYNVIGFIPGSGAAMGPRQGKGLDSQVIIVSAYYDGLGTGPDGTLYPGANDNASGVAAMLEMARVLQASPFRPDKTVMFVAWAGGERAEEFSVANIMGAKAGFNMLTVEAVVELSGVGAGSGSGLALGQGSSFRLVRLWQDAARRMGVGTTTRGRGPHFGMEAARAFGGRSALSIYVSWDGADANAHTPEDRVEAIDPQKLERAGRATLLGLFVLSREVNY